jgi:hypothetical protein
MPNPLRIKALITWEAVIFSRLSTPNFWLIISTIPISSMISVNIPKSSTFLTVIAHGLTCKLNSRYSNYLRQ